VPVPRFLLAALIMTLAVTRLAVADAVHADAPVLKVGDSWTLDFTHRGGEATRTIAAIDADGSATIRDDGVFGMLVRRVTKEWNPLGGQELDVHGAMVHAAYSPAGCWYRFPLVVGKSWGCDYTFRAGDLERQNHYSARVVGYGPVRTRAGTFDAFRIEATINDKFSGTHWYAPKVRTSIKFESQSLPDADYELVAYRLK
jgi:hypothetical protein